MIDEIINFIRVILVTWGHWSFVVRPELVFRAITGRSSGTLLCKEILFVPLAAAWLLLCRWFRGRSGVVVVVVVVVICPT